MVALALVLVAAACGSSGSTGAAGSAQSAPADQAVATTEPAPAEGCLPPGEPARATVGPYAVGTRTETYVDSSRGTQAAPGRKLAAKPDRTLPVEITYPAQGAPGGPAHPGATPAEGDFPLVIMAHGVTSDGATASALTEPWVAAGYVVASPTFPLSSGKGADINDLASQPGDLAFVARSLAAQVADPSDPLHGHVVTSCLALAGHSMGAATVLEGGFESTLLVPGVTAVVSFSGILAPVPGGSFDDAPPTPLLLVHGDKDLTVNISGSRHALEVLAGPTWFVTFHGAGHSDIFLPPYGRTLDAVVVGFLDAQLKGQASGTAAIDAAVQSSGGHASLQTART